MQAPEYLIVVAVLQIRAELPNVLDIGTQHSSWRNSCIICFFRIFTKSTSTFRICLSEMLGALQVVTWMVMGPPSEIGRGLHSSFCTQYLHTVPLVSYRFLPLWKLFTPWLTKCLLFNCHVNGVHHLIFMCWLLFFWTVSS